MGEEATIELWGFEFQWRGSGSFPLHYRREGGCDHDWVLVAYDHPLVAVVRDVAPPPDQESPEQRVRHIIGEFLRKWGYRQGMNNPGNVVHTGELYRALRDADLLAPECAGNGSEDAT